jgi:hypothetical protein
MPGKAEATIAFLAAATLGAAARTAASVPAPIPPALRPVIRATADLYWFDIVARNGGRWRYDGRWCVPTGYRLFGEGRFLGISSRGGELCGYTVLDRDGPADAYEMLTGAPPVFSPDRRRFVTAAIVGRSDVDGVSLWEVRPHETIRRFFPASLTGAGVKVESWVGSACVVLSAVGPSGERRRFELRAGSRVVLHPARDRRPCAPERK